MTMTTKLTIYWNSAPSNEVSAQVVQLTEENFTNAGKTTGFAWTNPFPRPTTGPYTTTREFASAQDAQDWMDQVLLPRATPANYTIEPLA